MTFRWCTRGWLAMQEWGLRCNWDYTVGSDGVAIDFLVLGERTSTLWKKNNNSWSFQYFEVEEVTCHAKWHLWCNSLETPYWIMGWHSSSCKLSRGVETLVRETKHCRMRKAKSVSNMDNPFPSSRHVPSLS